MLRPIPRHDSLQLIIVRSMQLSSNRQDLCCTDWAGNLLTPILTATTRDSEIPAAPRDIAASHVCYKQAVSARYRPHCEIVLSSGTARSAGSRSQAAPVNCRYSAAQRLLIFWAALRQSFGPVGGEDGEGTDRGRLGHVPETGAHLLEEFGTS